MNLLLLTVSVCVYSLADQIIEFISIPGCPAGKEAVNRRLYDQFLCIYGIDTASVENGDLFRSFMEQFSQSFFYDLVHGFRVVRSGGSAVYSDRPYRLIGDP